MSLPLTSVLALAVSLSAASSSVAAAQWRPQWTSPRVLPLLPTTTMPLVLLSLRPRPMMKGRTPARWWHLKACASAHLWTVPVNRPQPPRCCHRAAAVALCAAVTLCAAAADAAAAATSLPSYRQHRIVALPSPPLTLPLPPRCCRHAVHRRYASRCRHRR